MILYIYTQERKKKNKQTMIRPKSKKKKGNKGNIIHFIGCQPYKI